jgi:hypothetical protein
MAHFTTKKICLCLHKKSDFFFLMSNFHKILANLVNFPHPHPKKIILIQFYDSSVKKQRKGN